MVAFLSVKIFFLCIGGGIELVLDIDALTDAAETNPDISTVDAFTVSLLDVNIFESVETMCNVEATLNDEGHLIVVFEARSRRDSSTCSNKARVSGGSNIFLFFLGFCYYSFSFYQPLCL